MMRKIMLCAMAISVSGCRAMHTADIKGGREGSFVGNGADQHKDSDTYAWALGDQPFTWCIADFIDTSVTKEQLAASFTDAVRIWKKYVKEKGLIALNLPGPALTFANEYVKTCTGQEHITIIFGEKNADVIDALKQYEQPVAIVQLTHGINEEHDRGRGFLWIATGEPSESVPDWRDPDNRLGVFLHEFGHILGCQHVAGTIMDADFARYLTKTVGPSLLFPPFMYHYALNNIDFKKELFFNPAVSGAPSIWGFRGVPQAAERATFKQLTGEDMIDPDDTLGIDFIQGTETEVDKAFLHIFEIEKGKPAAPENLRGQWHFKITFQETLPTLPVTEAKVFIRNIKGHKSGLNVPAQLRKATISRKDGKGPTNEITYVRNQNNNSVLNLYFKNTETPFFEGNPFDQID